ncbi:type II secretion system F family protein [Longimicrobium sp.]|uniref:type II secretion system F family protein n=1 Tax=Longimicrobium sp. TaxID=2029185 RepID=UPI002E348FC3|nr:type II secretion system F family protein [Longimicrobium sp.]HEX6041741.1 type II secretion system F family protein [Longimicrobium sp.]
MSTGTTPQFAYRAAHRSGMLESGTVRAESAEAARELLFSRGLFPLEVRLERGREAARPRMSTGDLAQGLRVLATLLDSGLPVARALAAMDDLVPPAWTPALAPLRESVRQGNSLGAALAAAPVGFPPLVIGLVQAGEAGSGLGPAVTRAAELTESAAATRRAVRAALAYPLVLAAAGTASLVLLVGFVLPRFAAVLEDLGQALPPTARTVLGIADVARAAFVPGLFTLVVAGLLWRLWTGTEEGRAKWHAFLLAVPLVGGIRRASATARFCAALGALLESGVPIAPALNHATRATGDAALTGRILAAREGVVAGRSIAASLEAEDAATPTSVRMIRTGEETGRLAAMLSHASRIEADRAEQLVRALVRVLEPGMIIVFGGIVAFVAAALLQAVYSVRPM